MERRYAEMQQRGETNGVDTLRFGQRNNIVAAASPAATTAAGGSPAPGNGDVNMASPAGSSPAPIAPRNPIDDGRAGMAWGVYGVPETYLIDPSGQIKWRHAGPLTRDVITTQLLAKLAEMQ